VVRSPIDTARGLISLRSPLPLLAIGVGLALVVIVAATLQTRPSRQDPTKTPMFSHAEILAVVASNMRSGYAGEQVLHDGSARFDDGTWYISVGDAQFRYSQRNRVLVADNTAARELEYRTTAR
jgi:hypothetical protein